MEGVANVARLPQGIRRVLDPAKELELIAEILEVAGLKPPDFMPVDLAERDTPTVIDANELLWAARVLASLVRLPRNVIRARCVRT